MGFITQLQASLPLFILIFLGYFLIRFRKWPKSISEGLGKFVFTFAIPVMLFQTMANFYTQPPVDLKLLIAFFGGCLIVYFIGRIVAAKLFHFDGVSGSIFAIGGIFSNNVMLGLPLAAVLLGPAALPSVALVLAFNALILWTLVTVSIELAQNGSLSRKGMVSLAKSLIRNPILIGIACGLLVSMMHRPLPYIIAQPVEMISRMVAPLSLITLGMGLAEYGITEGWRLNFAICLIKLVILPLVILLLACALDIPPLETKTIVLLGSMSMGINVYLMARQFNTLVAPVASSLVLSTLLSAVTTPLFLTLVDLF